MKRSSPFIYPKTDQILMAEKVGLSPACYDSLLQSELPKRALRSTRKLDHLSRRDPVVALHSLVKADYRIPPP